MTFEEWYEQAGGMGDMKEYCREAYRAGQAEMRERISEFVIDWYSHPDWRTMPMEKSTISSFPLEGDDE